MKTKEKLTLLSNVVNYLAFIQVIRESMSWGLLPRSSYDTKFVALTKRVYLNMRDYIQKLQTWSSLQFANYLTVLMSLLSAVLLWAESPSQ